MQERVLRVLEFDKVKKQLLFHVASSLGKDKVERLQPSTNFEEVVDLQAQTDEARTVLRLYGEVPLGGITDVRMQIKRAQIGSTLGASELLDISGTMYATGQIKKFIDMLRSKEDLMLVYLIQYANELVALPHIDQEIRRCIDESGMILDSASMKLRSIRQQLRSTEGRIRDKLDSMVRSQSAQKMLSDAIVTMRNDRYVIPVKQEYRNSYGGIVHDQSSSGATLFIEPQAIVILNNQLQEARLQEEQEIERILIELSASIAEHAEELLHNISLLAEFDFMFAKAKYAHSIRGTKPLMNDKGYVRLIRARHPLIDAKQVVPNDMEIGDDFTTIVITGPNTGGKTVMLKTIGLFTLMAQAGLQIPALDDSQMAVFQAIYADIGDEQSIEQNLSTFSSHMTNIVSILKTIDDNSLVLFDELGAGTDPQEGAALAISILDEVHYCGARVIATTHYPELKAYGYNRIGVMNASVEFDVDTLSPTYKLLLGVPGRSNAFEISKRLGLRDHIINRARNQVSSDTNKVENMIASLEQSQKRAEDEQKEAEQLRKEAEQLHAEIQEKLLLLNEQQDKLLEEAKRKSIRMINESQKEAEEIIHSLREMQKATELKEHEIISARKRLEDVKPKLSTKKRARQKANREALQVGDEITIISLGQKGQLMKKLSNSEWQVQIGMMKTTVSESNIEFSKRPKEVETRIITMIKGKEHHASLELDLRGERFESAMGRVDKYIDDALLAGYPRISIIHGKGTGALRIGVQDMLKKHRAVKNFRYGEEGEGGFGVTVVEFK